MWGGEIFVPQIPSYRIRMLQKYHQMQNKDYWNFPGEKIHEEMITKTDALNG